MNKTPYPQMRLDIICCIYFDWLAFKVTFKEITFSIIKKIYINKKRKKEIKERERERGKERERERKKECERKWDKER